MARKKKKKPDEWHYSLTNIKKYGADYNLIIGERSNGKTYACLFEALENHVKDGSQTGLIRRFKEDFRGRRGSDLFGPLVANRVIEVLTEGRWTGVYYYSARWYLCRYDEDEKGNVTRVLAPEPFMLAFALIDMEHDKGTRYPHVKMIIFDEFISRHSYLADEFILFLNCLSTIIGERTDVKIYMLGNTVNKYCPYFAEMGLKHIRQQKQGTIDLYSIGETGLKIAVEYCAATNKASKKSNKYFSFDNQKVNMIMSGIWELDVYPHCPISYEPIDISFIFFIIFDSDILQCEVISKGESVFLFIHRKTTKLQSPNKDLIYSTHTDVRPNWRNNILKDRSKAGNIICKLFDANKVFYQDNEVGEIVRNYLIWCGKAAV